MTVDVADASAFPAAGGFRIEIGNELFDVTAVAGNTFTVTRGVDGTTAAAAVIGDDVRLASDSFTVTRGAGGTLARNHALNATVVLPGDSFTFLNTGDLTGAIDGGAGLVLLVGDNDGNVIRITSTNGGVLRQSDDVTEKIANGFINIENISGGTASDQIFVVTGGADLTGNILGGSGNDTITVGANQIGGIIDGGLGNDIINLNDGARVSSSDVTGVVGLGGDDEFNIAGTVTANLAGDSEDDTFTLATSAVLKRMYPPRLIEHVSPAASPAYENCMRVTIGFETDMDLAEGMIEEFLNA